MTSLPIRVHKLAIVGLGNFEFPQTRHSVGQLLLESLCKKAASVPGAVGRPSLRLNLIRTAWTSLITLSTPPPELLQDRLSSHDPSTSLSEATLGRPLQLCFIKARAYMNVSGPPIHSVLQAFFSDDLTEPIPPWRTLVLQDDLDVQPLHAKLQVGGSARGHNGVRSLIHSFGGRKDFCRFKIGIGRPLTDETGGEEDVAEFVLGRLGEAEHEACLFQSTSEWEGGMVSRAWLEILKMGYADTNVEGYPLCLGNRRIQ